MQAIFVTAIAIRVCSTAASAAQHGRRLAASIKMSARGTIRLRPASACHKCSFAHQLLHLATQYTILLPFCRSQHLIGAQATQGGTHKYGVIEPQHLPYPPRKGNGSERPMSIDKAALSFSFSSTAMPAGDRHRIDRSQMRCSPATGRLICSLDALPCMAMSRTTTVPIVGGLLESLIHSWT